MKTEKPTPSPDDIELVPDAWDRFVDAVKKIARHPPVEHPTGHGKLSNPKKRLRSQSRDRHREKHRVPKADDP